MTIIIETKFNKGDEVWYIANDQIYQDTVTEIIVKHNPSHAEPFKLGYYTECGGADKWEGALFATQQELIDHLTDPAHIRKIDQRMKSKPA